MSAIIGMAYIFVNPSEDEFDIGSINLELPSNVRSHLHGSLLPYLSAIQLSGYETTQTRKAYFMGNTGKETGCVVKVVRKKICMTG